MDIRVEFEGCEPVFANWGGLPAIPYSPPAPVSTPRAIAGLSSGFAAGTEVATLDGPRPVETLAAGDRVLTLDHDVQTVRAVQRGFLWRGCAPCPAPLWPLMVPEGALGNAKPLTLLPEQCVLVESDLAAELYGDALVLIPARYLEGALGIQRFAPTPCRPVEVVIPIFDRPEIAFANGATRVFCPTQGQGAARPAPRPGLPRGTGASLHPRPVTPHEARRLAAAFADARGGMCPPPGLLPQAA